MLENCPQEFYYFPLRALKEFYTQDLEAKALGKRLNSESLLSYKAQKEWKGRKNQLFDFKK